MADRVESVIREKIVFLAGRPGAGHWREDLTDAAVRFFPIFSYLIVYRPETTPLQIIAILHGRRDGGTIPSRPLIADLTLYSGYGLSPAIIPPPASTFASPCPTQSV
jgi:hypothetical protein